MSHHVIEFDEECTSCKGTGIYVGLAERDGAAVVCWKCKGRGWVHTKIEYDDPVTKTVPKPSTGITTVFQATAGICVGSNEEAGLLVERDFGGMPYSNWYKGEPFPDKSEMRKFTCPAWWYQSVDYDKKPQWDECLGSASFSSCKYFKEKAKCWERWDKEFGDE